jgi:hypothetical protein
MAASSEAATSPRRSSASAPPTRASAPGRPQTNGHVEVLRWRILDQCWRPAFARYLHLRFTGLKREFEPCINYFNYDRVRYGRQTLGRIPAELVYGACKLEAR